MGYPLRYNTASQEIPLGPFLDDTDGKTEETALTIANTDIRLTKCGGTTHVDKNSGGATHDAQGIYYATLDATDCNALGAMVINCRMAGALPVRLECEVLSQAAYDFLYGATALPVEVTTKTGFSLAADQSTVTIGTVNALAAGAYTAIATAVRDLATSGLAALKTLIDAIGSKTTNLPAAPAAVGDIPTAVQVRTELDANSTRLAHLDADVSTRLATAGYTAPPSVAGLATEANATANHNAVIAALPVAAPTAAANATAVRSELATELARIDVATGTRLATAGYTAPPSIVGLATEANASANAGAIVAAMPVPPSVASIAAGVLVTPANKLATNADGSVNAVATVDTTAIATDVVEAMEAAGVPTLAAIEGSTVLAKEASVAALPTDADVQTAAAAALSAYDPPTRAEATADKNAVIAAMPVPPTSAANAGAVRSELGVELARLDANVSSRLATAGYTAPPAVPTAAQIRAEMDANSPKLAHLDVDVSTRLAASAYTAPPALTGLATEAGATANTAALLGALPAEAPSAAEVATAAAAAILATPANKLAVNEDGTVSATATVDASALDTALSAAHGAGLWGAAAVGDAWITHASEDDDGDVMGITTPGAAITAYLDADAGRTTPKRTALAQTDGQWAIALAPDATYTLVFAKDGYAETTRTVTT